MNEINEAFLPQREKYWEELSAEEKIERLGRQIEYLQGIVNSQAEIIGNLRNHVHVADKMYFSDVPQPHHGWPNNNILSRRGKK